MNHKYLALVLSSSFLTAWAGSPDMQLSVDLQSHGADVSPQLYGVFFEEINHAGEGGLYGELLQNRSFEDKVIPAGYHVENGSLVPFSAINYGTGFATPRSYQWTDDPYPGLSMPALARVWPASSS